MPLDHPDGEKPTIVFEGSKFETHRLADVLKTMANETHVLILIDTNRIFDEFIDKMIAKLPKDSYVQHHVFKQDTIGAEAWIKDVNLMKIGRRQSNPKQKGVF
mgnify:CR=1 FL=1